MKAEWLSAAASVCASPATSIRRICSAGPIATSVPKKNVASAAVTGWCAAGTNSTITTIDHNNTLPTVGMSALSAMREPTTLPTTMPRPNSESTNGISAGGMPATSISVGLM